MLLLLLLFYLALQPAAGLELRVSPADGGPPLVAVPLEPGERFTLRYVHSVTREPIWEEHTADRHGDLFIEEERFVVLGAGMGHWPGRGELTMRGRYQVITGIHARLTDRAGGRPGLHLRVGRPGVDHTLVIRGVEIPLTPRAAGQLVVLEAGPR